MGSSTKKTTSNSTSSATTTPNVPSWAAGPVENYFGQVGGLISKNWSDPNFLATPTNSLQQTAATNAANLPTGQAELGQSNAMASAAGNASAGTYTPPTLGEIGKINPVTVSGATLGPAAQAALAQAQAAQAGPAASLLDNFQAYINPYLSNVRDAAMTDFDANAGKARAAASNQLAKTGAFGGSRGAIYQSALEGDLSRARAATDAGLLSDAFNTAAGLSNTDAGRRQEVNLYNTSNQQQTNLANTGWANDNNQFNTGQTNDFAKTQASLNQQAALAQAQIAAQQEAMRFQAEQERAMAQAGYDAQGGMFNANLGQQQLDRQLAAAGLLSNNAGAASTIANNNVNTQAGVGQGLWNIDQYNNGSEVAGLGAIQSLLDGYQPFVGQTINGTESGTQTQKSSGGLLGGLGGLLSIVPGISSIGSLFGGGAAAAKAAQKGY